MKELLSREGVPFTARNVDEDEAAYDALLALGLRTVPVTVIGDEHVKGFDVPALTRALAAWRSGR
ncbi:MAG TPA: glutaredoxin family protein [Vicinamibacterales bacterium]|nr:glutaredoxin family protein [Vicinamibacterales bacterium]